MQSLISRPCLLAAMTEINADVLQERARPRANLFARWYPIRHILDHRQMPAGQRTVCIRSAPAVRTVFLQIRKGVKKYTGQTEDSRHPGTYRVVCLCDKSYLSDGSIFASLVSSLSLPSASPFLTGWEAVFSRSFIPPRQTIPYTRMSSSVYVRRPIWHHLPLRHPGLL